VADFHTKSEHLAGEAGVDGCNHEPSRQRMAPAVIRPPAARTASPKPSSSSAASAFGHIVIAAPVEVSVRRSMTLTW
jgi:hypothetical protein